MINVPRSADHQSSVHKQALVTWASQLHNSFYFEFKYIQDNINLRLVSRLFCNYVKSIKKKIKNKK